MLTAYLRIPQEGIEPLENKVSPVKDKETGHFYFDDFRIALQYYWDEKEKSSGIAIFSFGPNGSLWSETGEHCKSLNQIAGYYFGTEQGLVEAEKSKAKQVTIYIPNKEVVSLLNSETNPFKDKNYKNLHSYILGLTKKFNIVKFVFRVKYPPTTKKWLLGEAKKSAEPPQYSGNGYYLNARGKSYSNIDEDKEQMKLIAEQFAHLFYDLHQSQMKSIKDEYGDEKFGELIKGLNSGEIKKLPDTKKVRESRKGTFMLKKYTTPNKTPVKCHYCGDEMKVEKATLEKPENIKNYIFRCNRCLATKTLNEKGRTVRYGRYMKSEKLRSEQIGNFN